MQPQDGSIRNQVSTCCHALKLGVQLHSAAGFTLFYAHTPPLPPSPRPQALDDAASISQVDPYAVVQPEVKAISERLRHSVSSTVPVLKQAAEYFFRKGVEGKRLRPTLVMLMASALADAPPAAEFLGVDLRPASEPTTELRRRQQRIAEIAELIHVASLLHDDVIDEASTRRGILSLNATVGNKVSILSGDFLLARASVTLGALRNTEIVELMSQILEYLVSGEIMQVNNIRPVCIASTSSSTHFGFEYLGWQHSVRARNFPNSWFGCL